MRHAGIVALALCLLGCGGAKDAAVPKVPAKAPAAAKSEPPRAGRPGEVIYVSGRVARYTYTAGRLQAVEIDGRRITFGKQVVWPNGFKTSVSFDSARRPAEIVHQGASGRAVVSRRYDGIGRVVHIREDHGETQREATCTYDIYGRLAQGIEDFLLRDESGEVVATYRKHGTLSEQGGTKVHFSEPTDPSRAGLAYHFAEGTYILRGRDTVRFDQRGLFAERRRGQFSLRATWHKGGLRTLSWSNGEGHTEQATIKSNGQKLATQVIAPAGRFTMERDGAGLVTSVGKVRLRYQGSELQSVEGMKVARPQPPKLAIDLAKREAQLPELGLTMKYDPQGRLAAAHAAGRRVLAIERERKGKRDRTVLRTPDQIFTWEAEPSGLAAYSWQSTTDAAKKVSVELKRDVMGRPLALFSQAKQLLSFGWMGYQVTGISYPGGTIEMDRDDQGRLIKLTGPGFEQRSSYQGSRLRRTMERRGSLQSVLELDSQGRVSRAVTMAGVALGYSYDDQGRISSSSIGKDRRYQYAYGSAGQLERITFPDGSTRPAR